VTCIPPGLPGLAVRNGTITACATTARSHVADGSVKSGPASRGRLAGKNITVAGDSISLA
jgi:hypothetical protein